MNNTFKRKEIKYLLSSDQRKSFEKAITQYIQKDQFSNYTICNIYFDTPDCRLIRRSIEKPVYKEKMRIRSYGKADDSTKVFIELKKKFQGVVYKRRVSMPMGEAFAYVSGESSRSGQVEEEINYFIKMYEGISPAMYIAYDRKAYFVTEDPELRITFDDNILWRDEDISLSSDVYGHTILDRGQSLMEIKCAGAMPLWLVRALADNRIYQSSFSKYGEAYQRKLALKLAN
jgi:SPX domain protein involved in polyphosphate accumulation